MGTYGILYVQPSGISSEHQGQPRGFSLCFAIAFFKFLAGLDNWGSNFKFLRHAFFFLETARMMSITEWRHFAALVWSHLCMKGRFSRSPHQKLRLTMSQYGVSTLDSTYVEGIGS